MKKTTLILPLLFSFIFGFGQVTLDTKLVEYYDSGSATYINSEQSEYQYDGNGNLLETIESSWDGSMWVNSGKIDYTYVNNNRTSETASSWISNAWVVQFRTNYTFDVSNLLTQFVGQNWDGSIWVDDFKIDATYLGNNKIDSYLEYEWNGASWVNLGRGEITYDGSNLDFIEVDEWDGSQWVNLERETYTINGGTGKIEQQLIEDWNGSSWDNGAKFEYVLDGSFNRTSYKDSNYNGSIWVLNYLDSNTFDNTTLMSTIHHPFDAIDHDLGLEDFPYYHKILSKIEYQSDGITITSRTTYAYSNDTTSVKDYNQFELEVYPNPTSDYFRINIRNFEVNASLEIFDLLGSQVKASNLKNNNVLVDISNLSKGVYFLKILSDGKIATKKIIKK